MKDYVIATWFSHYKAWELVADLHGPTNPSHSEFRSNRTFQLLNGDLVQNIGLEEPKVLILEDDVDWELDVANRLPLILNADTTRPDEYGFGVVKGFDLLYPGWCYEFGLEKPFETGPYERVTGKVDVPGKTMEDGTKLVDRTYNFARPIFPACLQWVSKDRLGPEPTFLTCNSQPHDSAYIITLSAARYLLQSTLPSHVLHPHLLLQHHSMLPYAWDPIDIWVSNKPAKHVFHTLVLHPPLFKQIPEDKPQGEKLLKSARMAYWERESKRLGRSVEQLEREQRVLIAEERGETMVKGPTEVGNP